MSATTETLTDSLVGFAFPLIVVKYHGATNYRGSRFVATLKRYEGMTDGTVRLASASASYDYGTNASKQRLYLARACWSKHLNAHDTGSEDVPVFVPVDMPNGDTGYAVVPAHVLGVSA